MPRYFFHVYDGESLPDESGSELADIYSAQTEAIHLSGELLKEMGGRFWNGDEWRLEVADATGQVLFVLRFSAEERSTASTGLPGQTNRPEARRIGPGAGSCVESR